VIYIFCWYIVLTKSIWLVHFLSRDRFYQIFPPRPGNSGQRAFTRKVEIFLIIRNISSILLCLVWKRYIGLIYIFQ
jgi:hypothetical protein